jgi:hypothetical protein
VTVDALADLPRRTRRQLPPEDSIRSAFACSVNDRDAVLVLTDAQVWVVGRGGWFVDDALLDSAWHTPLGELACDLRFRNTRRRVQFRSAADAQTAVREIGRATDAARGGNGAPEPLGPDERLVARCVYLGGVNISVSVEAEVDVLFGSDDIRVHYSPRVRTSRAIAQLPYAPQFAIELSDPAASRPAAASSAAASSAAASASEEPRRAWP